jgi:hemerythrin-like metal-binding protein
MTAYFITFANMLSNHLIWNAGLHGVGVEAIDSEHRQMIDIINRINDLIEKGGQLEDARDAMDELLTLTQGHFVHEERIMEQSAYPGMAAHTEEHRKLLEQMRNLIGDAKRTRSSLRIGLVPAFLSDWAERHILQDDRKLGEFLAALGENTLHRATPP